MGFAKSKFIGRLSLPAAEITLAVMILFSHSARTEEYSKLCLGEWPCPEKYICERCVSLPVEIRRIKKHPIKQNHCIAIPFDFTAENYEGKGVTMQCPLQRRKKTKEEIGK